MEDNGASGGSPPETLLPPHRIDVEGSPAPPSATHHGDSDSDIDDLSPPISPIGNVDMSVSYGMEVSPFALGVLLAGYSG